MLLRVLLDKQGNGEDLEASLGYLLAGWEWEGSTGILQKGKGDSSSSPLSERKGREENMKY